MVSITWLLLSFLLQISLLLSIFSKGTVSAAFSVDQENIVSSQNYLWLMLNIVDIITLNHNRLLDDFYRISTTADVHYADR